MPSAASLNEDWQQYRCILWGGYAAGNVGDELTLAVALQDMTAHFGDSVAILSGVPGYTRRLFPGRPVIPYEPIARRDTSRIYHKLERKLRRIVGGKRASIYSVQHQLSSAAWAKQLRACEMLYLVGGGYFSDMFQLDWLLLPVSVARSGGARIATAPIGLGPFRSARWAKRVADALQGATLVVRDEASLQLCQNFGVPAEHRRDDGFRALEVLEELNRISARATRPRRIGVNIFNQHGSARHSDSRAWWEALLKLLPRDDTIIEGFCFHNYLLSDFAVTAESFAEAGLDPHMVRLPEFDFRAGCTQLRDFDGIVSSRFHAIVVGNVIGKRTYAICDGDYYSHKMKAATKECDRSTLVRQFDSCPEQIAAQILQDGFSSPQAVTAA